MKNKKLFLILTCAALLATAGCGGKKDEAENTAGDGPLTYWCKLETVHKTSVSTLNDLEYYKKLQEVTGVEIEFVHPPSGQESEQFNLMMTSRDYPDIIESNWSSRKGGADKAIKDRVIIPLNEMIEKSVPNYKKLLEENDNIRKAFTTDTGNIFAFGGVVRTPGISSGGMMVREDFLKELGMEAPDSMEDWETYFSRLKNEKGIDAPFTTDKYRMENAKLFMSNYGIGTGFYVDADGKVQYGPARPEYKEYLTKMNEWFEKGYLDNGLFSNTQAIAEAKVLNGESGAFYGFIGSTMGRLLPAAKTEEFSLIGVGPASLKEGEKPTICGGTPYTGSDEVYPLGYSLTANAAVTTNNQKLEKTAKLFDYLYTEEGNLLKNFGVEGVTYTMKDGIPTYTDAILHDPDGLPIADAMGKYFRATYPNPGYMNDIIYYDQYYQYPQQKEAMRTFMADESMYVSYTMPPTSLLEEETDEISNKISTISTLTAEMFTKFIMGTASMDEFDKYIDTLNEMGLPRVIEIYQTALERYKTR